MIENPGPLANMKGNPAANFAGGKYNQVVLQEDLILYRGGQKGNPWGQWFARAPKEPGMLYRIDSAVKPQWTSPKTGRLEAVSPIDAVFKIKIPKGTTIYVGPTGYQGGIYLGGQDFGQIFINQPWNIPGVEVLGSQGIQ